MNSPAGGCQRNGFPPGASLAYTRCPFEGKVRFESRGNSGKPDWFVHDVRLGEKSVLDRRRTSAGRPEVLELGRELFASEAFEGGKPQAQRDGPTVRLVCGPEMANSVDSRAR